VFYAHAAPNRMFCRGDEPPRAIKIPDPMPAVGPSLRPCATGGRSARSAGAGLVAVPDRDGERPARRAYCRAQHASMHADQELLALATLMGTSMTASRQCGTWSVAGSVLPEGPEVHATRKGDQDPGSRHRRDAAEGDLAIPPAVQASQADAGKTGRLSASRGHARRQRPCG
jgi:hypothetical protein